MAWFCSQDMKWIEIEGVSTCKLHGTTWQAHDFQWHDMTRGELTWHDFKCYDMASNDMTWLQMTWHDFKWHDTTSNDNARHTTTWFDLTWSGIPQHGMTWFQMTWHDFKWHETTSNDMHDIPQHDLIWHEITYHNMTWQDIKCHGTTSNDTVWLQMTCTTWHNMIWFDMKWHTTTWYDVTSNDMTWLQMTWHDLTWTDIPWHDMVWLQMACHDVKWHDLISNDKTWNKWWYAIKSHVVARRDVTWHATDTKWSDMTWLFISVNLFTCLMIAISCGVQQGVLQSTLHLCHINHEGVVRGFASSHTQHRTCSGRRKGVSCDTMCCEVHDALSPFAFHFVFFISVVIYFRYTSPAGARESPPMTPHPPFGEMATCGKSCSWYVAGSTACPFGLACLGSLSCWGSVLVNFRSSHELGKAWSRDSTPRRRAQGVGNERWPRRTEEVKSREDLATKGLHLVEQERRRLEETQREEQQQNELKLQRRLMDLQATRLVEELRVAHAMKTCCPFPDRRRSPLPRHVRENRKCQNSPRKKYLSSDFTSRGGALGD